MSRSAPGKCPACQSQLQVKRLECPGCGTGIDGSFELCKYCQLAQEHREFLEVFLAARGSIRDVERVLGISYPTVRGKLNALLEALGLSGAEVGEAGERRSKKDVLKDLDSGVIDVEEALRQLRKV